MFKWIKDQIVGTEDQNEKKSELTDDLLDEKTAYEDDAVDIEKIEQEEVSDKNLDKPSEKDPTLIEKESTEDKSEISIESEDQPTVEAQETDDTEDNKGFLKKIFSGLEKTRNEFTGRLGMILGSYVTIDDEMYEDLEDILITADIGVQTTMELIDNLKQRIVAEKIKDPNEVVPLLADEAKKLVINNQSNYFDPTNTPAIILVVGVNGVGKTTTIGKLAAKYKKDNKNVMLVAADTFRAAATEQLKEWSNRAQVDIIAQSEGADPAAVVYDALQAAKARGTDIVLIDTAGRLHNKTNLMNELAKIYGVIDREYPEANRESLIVLDATTGQNAINQARQFKEVVDITGVALTKLDGTAKGGVVLPLIAELQLPVVYIGIGEQIDDLQEFDPDVFVDSIFDRGSIN